MRPDSQTLAPLAPASLSRGLDEEAVGGASGRLGGVMHNGWAYLQLLKWLNTQQRNGAVVMAVVSLEIPRRYFRRIVGGAGV